MHSRWPITTLLTGVLLVAGCGDDATSPRSIRQVTELGGLRLEIDVERTTIALGDSGTLTMRLRNPTAEAVRLTFGSSCQIMPYIENAAGAVQYPGGGAWGCAAMITSLDVPAGGAVTRTLLVRGVPAADGVRGSSLPPGRYRAYALLEGISEGFSDHFQLRSPTIEFEVR